MTTYREIPIDVCTLCSKIAQAGDPNNQKGLLMDTHEHDLGVARLYLCDDCTASFKRWKTSRINKEFDNG